MTMCRLADFNSRWLADEHLMAGTDMSDKACKAYSVDLSAYFDGELEGDELARLEAHLDDCDACRGSLDRFTQLRSALNSMAKPPRRRGSILDELQAKLKVEAGGKPRAS